MKPRKAEAKNQLKFGILLVVVLTAGLVWHVKRNEMIFIATDIPFILVGAYMILDAVVDLKK